MTIAEIIAELHEKKNIPAAHALECINDTLREVLNETGETCDYCLYCEEEHDDCLDADADCHDCPHTECHCWSCRRSVDASGFEFDHENI